MAASRPSSQKKFYFAGASEIARMDRLAVAAGLSVRQMMELAGFHILELLRRLKFQKKGFIVILVGKGNKGGDGLSAARHLINNGYRVAIILTARRIKPDAAHLLRLLERLAVRDGQVRGRAKKVRTDIGAGVNKLRIIYYPEQKEIAERLLKKADLIIDALIGYRLKGAPRKPIAALIKKANSLANSLNKKIIAYDLPTGLDATSGVCFEPCIKAWATLTLALPKKGFLAAGGRSKRDFSSIKGFLAAKSRKKGDFSSKRGVLSTDFAFHASKKRDKNVFGQNVFGRLFLADLGISAPLYRATAAQARRPDFDRSGLIEL